MEISIKACKKCSGVLFTPSGRCRQCLRAAGTKYRATHIEKELARVNAWAKNNPEKIKAKDIAYLEKNKELIAIKRSAYLEKNKEKTRAWWLVYKNKNKERINFMSRAWGVKNPESRRIADQNRRARKNSTGGSLSRGLAKKLIALQKGKCPCCAQPLGDDYHMDHKMPLALGGTNTDDNMQLLRKACNLQKSKKHPIDFMQQRGFLL